MKAGREEGRDSKREVRKRDDERVKLRNVGH